MGDWIEKGKRAPDFRLADADGKPVTLAQFRGRPVVLGVSPDGSASHARFRDKYGLDFPLLADPDHEVAEAYGAWREKVLYGKKSIGIQRSTYLIDPEGVVRDVWRKVSVDGHDQEVLAALDAL